MAIAYNSDASLLFGISAGNSSGNASFTVPSGNPLVIVYIDMVDTTSLPSVSSVTCGTGNGAIVGAVTRASNANRRAEMWYVKAPPTGSQTVTLTLSANIHNAAAIYVWSFTGVDQTAPLDNAATSNTEAQTTSTTQTPSSSSNVLITGATDNQGNDTSHITGLTTTSGSATVDAKIWDFAFTGTTVALGHVLSASGSTTLTWTSTFGNWYAMITGSFKQAATNAVKQQAMSQWSWAV